MKNMTRKKEKWNIIASEYVASPFPVFILADSMVGDMVEVDANKGVVKKI